LRETYRARIRAKDINYWTVTGHPKARLLERKESFFAPVNIEQWSRRKGNKDLKEQNADSSIGETLMKNKEILMISSILVLISSLAATPLNAVELPTLSVEPSSIIDETLVAGSGFSVDIVISDVTDLGGYEFKLSYDTSVVTATGITYNDDPGFFHTHFTWTEQMNDLEGWLWLVVTLPIGTLQGVDGTGTVVTIDFTVDDLGGTVLDLYDTQLGTPTADPILHESVDGYFSNIVPGPPPIYEVDLVKRSAWPEYHHHVTAKQGVIQTLYALVGNKGTTATMVYVVFEIWTAKDPILVDTSTTSPEEVAVDESRELSAPWQVVGGRFKVFAQCWYQDAESNWIAGTKIKTFGFAVVVDLGISPE